MLNGSVIGREAANNAFSTSNLVLLPNVYVVEELACENECRILRGTYAPCCVGKLRNNFLSAEFWEEQKMKTISQKLSNLLMRGQISSSRIVANKRLAAALAER